MNILDKIKELDKNYAAEKKTLIKELKDNIREVFAEVFDMSPNIDSIGWTQYTPYFNDGDPCRFTLGEAHINGHEEYDDEDEEKELPAIENENEVYHKVYLIMRQIPRAYLEDMFNNDVRVFIYRDGRVALDCYDNHD